MPGLLGLGSTVTVGTQTDAVTPNTSTRQSLNIYSISGGETENLPDDNILGGGMNNDSDPTQPAPGLATHELSLEVPLCTNQFAYWLTAFFGAAADAGSTPNYTHTFHSGVAPPWLTIEHMLSSSDGRTHIGCMGEELTIDWNAEKDGFAPVSLKFIGLKENIISAASAGTITPAPTLARPAQQLVDVLYNSVAGGDLIGGSLTFKRNLKRFRAADGTGIPYEVNKAGRSSLSGKISMRYEGSTRQADAIARTVRALSIQLMSGANTGIQFSPPKIQLEKTPISVSGPDAVMLDMNWIGFQDPSGPALNIVAKDQTAAYTL
jgi:hypothetical protein